MQQNMISRLQPEERLLFSCLRQELSQAEAKQLVADFENAGIVWDIVYSIAFVQGVSPLIQKNLKTCRLHGLTIPADTMAAFERCRIAADEIKSDRNRKLGEILGFFSRAGEDVMLLKGAAYDAVVFLSPALTVSGDIDLLVKCQADRFSYDQLQYLYDFNRKESFELSFQDHHDLDVNGVLSVDYEKIWSDSSVIDLLGSKCAVMALEDLLIFACVNSGRKRYFHLKALFNISEIIATCSSIDWSVVAKKARLYGCEKIVFAALLATSLTTGRAIPKNLAETMRINFLTQKLIGYLVKNMSFSDLADRTLRLDGGAAVTGLADKDKWNRSGLLLLAVYRPAQLARRLKILLTPRKVY